MSRTPRQRSTSRTGQIHLCAVCVADAGGYHAGGLTKQLTWMLEIPPESDTSARLGGRARTWFCRSCIASTFEADPIFAKRNSDLELRDPQWWTHPGHGCPDPPTSPRSWTSARVPEDLGRENRRRRRERHEGGDLPLAFLPRRRAVDATGGRQGRDARTTGDRALRPRR